MNQDQANQMLPPVTGSDRVAAFVATIFIAGFSVWIIASFTFVAGVVGLPVAIALVLAIPVFWWIVLRSLRAHASEPPWFTVLGLGGVTIALVLVIVRDIASPSSPFALPTTFEISVSVLEWLGVALVAIGDLMLIAALGGFFLARLRASE